jgi:FtsP/CotA-like multicopper oxidase with cupredoxin domain
LKFFCPYVIEILVDGVPVKLRWAMNNISNDHGSNPLISKALDTARSLGTWPADIAETVAVPTSPPFVWNYTQNVTGPGGPGVALGTLQESVMSFRKGQVIEIVLQNARAINSVAEFHPWHLHGHSFWVVGTGQGIFDATTDVATYNLVNPILRDTVVLQPLGWTAVRFITDNPGAWLFHCHICTYSVNHVYFVLSCCFGVFCSIKVIHIFAKFLISSSSY